ncbi:MAG: hypothetical protein JST04_18190 [Bdellovibrionales bacterium]|nr:hypothetical protein [Bdellovibrionales bacterium]
MKKFTSRSLATFLFLGFAVSAGAATAKTVAKTVAKTTVKSTPAGPAPEVMPPPSAEEYQAAIAAAEERGGRKVATTESRNETTNFSDSFIALRKRVFAAKTPEDLHSILRDLDNDAFYNTLGDDAKFAAAQMAPLIAFNGFFNRAIDWIEPTPITRLGAVATLRAVGAGVMTYLPTDQWKAGMKYLTVPNTGTGKPITNELEFHDFLNNEVRPKLGKARDRLHALNFANKTVYFDAKIFYADADFFSDQDRFIRMGEAERHAALSNVHYALSSLCSLNAYNLNGLFSAIDTLSKKFGYGSAFRYNPEVTTDRVRFDVLRAQNNRTGLFDLREGGQGWMNSAYADLKWAVAEASYSWAELRRRQNDESTFGNLLDPRGTTPIARMMTTGLHNLSYVTTVDKTYSNTAKDGSKVDGVTSAVVSNESAKIDLASFYHSAPKSLVDLFPLKDGFDTAPYNRTMTVEIVDKDGKSVLNAKGEKTWSKPKPYHDFTAGRAIKWDVKKYETLFPELKGLSEKDAQKRIPQIARVLSQSWGGWLVGMPMASLIL